MIEFELDGFDGSIKIAAGVAPADAQGNDATTLVFRFYEHSRLRARPVPYVPSDPRFLLMGTCDLEIENRRIQRIRLSITIGSDRGADRLERPWLVRQTRFPTDPGDDCPGRGWQGNTREDVTKVTPSMKLKQIRESN